MKKLIGWIYLFGSILWCLLLVPGAFLAPFGKLLGIKSMQDADSNTIDVLLNLLVLFGRITMAVLIVYFGVSLVKSSWKMIKGINEEDERMKNFHEKVQAKLNKANPADAEKRLG